MSSRLCDVMLAWHLPFAIALRICLLPQWPQVHRPLAILEASSAICSVNYERRGGNDPPKSSISKRLQHNLQSAKSCLHWRGLVRLASSARRNAVQTSRCDHGKPALLTCVKARPLVGALNLRRYGSTSMCFSLCARTGLLHPDKHEVDRLPRVPRGAPSIQPKAASPTSRTSDHRQGREGRLFGGTTLRAAMCFGEVVH